MFFNQATLTGFRENRMLLNASLLFLLTTLFYFLGAMMRLVEPLSLFWPLNAAIRSLTGRAITPSVMWRCSPMTR